MVWSGEGGDNYLEIGGAGGGGGQQRANPEGAAGRARHPGADRPASGGGWRWCRFCRPFGAERREESGVGPCRVQSRRGRGVGGRGGHE